MSSGCYMLLPFEPSKLLIPGSLTPSSPMDTLSLMSCPEAISSRKSGTELCFRPEVVPEGEGRQYPPQRLPHSRCGPSMAKYGPARLSSTGLFTSHSAAGSPR